MPQEQTHHNWRHNGYLLSYTYGEQADLQESHATQGIVARCDFVISIGACRIHVCKLRGKLKEATSPLEPSPPLTNDQATVSDSRSPTIRHDQMENEESGSSPLRPSDDSPGMERYLQSVHAVCMRSERLPEFSPAIDEDQATISDGVSSTMEDDEMEIDQTLTSALRMAHDHQAARDADVASREISEVAGEDRISSDLLQVANEHYAALRISSWAE